MVILDHKTKLVVRWDATERKNTVLALGTLSMTHSNLEAMGMSLEDCFIHHDQDTVYTGYRCLQAVLTRERAKGHDGRRRGERTKARPTKVVG